MKKIVLYLGLMILLISLVSAYTGTGTVNDPYMLYTCEDLQPPSSGANSIFFQDEMYNTNYSKSYYKLANDIDCSSSINWNGGGGFAPIGFKNKTEGWGTWSGTFDGQGYTISNIYMNANGWKNYSGDHAGLGLFTELTNYYSNETTFVKNFNIENMTITTYGQPVGGLSAWLYDYSGTPSYEGIFIENINYNNIDIRIVNDTGWWGWTGGIVGDLYDEVTIRNFTGTNMYVQGEVEIGLFGGVCWLVNMTNVSMQGIINITDPDQDGWQIGGLCGRGGMGTFSNINIDVEINCQEPDGIKDVSSTIGGMIGDFSDGGSVISSKVKSKINNCDNEIGGLFGISYGDNYGDDFPVVVYQTYVNTQINNSNKTVGGISGKIVLATDYYISDSYIDGYINSDSKTSSIFGDITTGEKLYINDIYSNLTINSTTGDAYCDFYYNPATIGSVYEGIYYNSDNCIYNKTVYSETFETSEIKTASTFPSFNFSTEWIMIEDYTNPIPLTLWENGSVIIYSFYDMVTGLAINNTNMTVITDGDNTYYSENYIENLSEFWVWNLPADEYSLSVIAEGYEYSQFNVELGSADILFLNMYLLNSDDSGGATAFRIRDKNTGNPIYEANVDVYRKILGLVWTKVASYKSDIIGKVQFSYLPYKSYRFVVSKDGYVNQDFTINPITQTLYTINMEQDGTLPLSSITVTPENKNFYNGMVQNFSVRFYSSNGSFSNYSVSLTYPGGNVSASGTQPTGSLLSVTLNISGASLYDMVYINLSYTANGETVTNRIAHYVVISPGEYTISKNKTEFYGLGIFERVLISTMLILVVAGIGMISIGTLASGGLGLIIAGYLAFIGFLPVIIAIPLIVGFIIISWRSSQ